MSILLSKNLLGSVQCGGGSQGGPPLSCGHVDASFHVHIEDVTITTSILLIQPKIYHKSVSKKLTDYLS